MVSTRPSSRITMPLPARSVPSSGAVNASSGISARRPTTASSAVSSSKRQSSCFGRMSTGKAHSCFAMLRFYDPMWSSADDEVGALQQRAGDADADRRRRLHVHHQLEVRRLLDRQLAWLRTLEDLVDVGRSLAVEARKIGAIA